MPKFADSLRGNLPSIPEALANEMMAYHYPLNTRLKWDEVLRLTEERSYAGNDYLKRIHYQKATRIIKKWYELWLMYPTRDGGVPKNYGIRT